MRLEKIKIHGMEPFDDAEVDFSKINGKVVAIVGKNGAGKSVFLEMWPGLIYRDTPTHGSLTRIAFKRDAFVKGTIHNGKCYHITQNADAHTNKSESLLLDADNRPLMDTTKVSDYDKWAEKNLPDPSVMFAGPFAVQGRLGIIKLKPAQRKSVLLKAIGVERYETMAKQARKNFDTTKGKLNTLTARISDEEGHAISVNDARQQLADAEQNVERHDINVGIERTAYTRALSASENAQRAKELKEQRQAVQDRLQVAQRELADIERRLANNQKLLGRSSEINRAVERITEIDKEVLELKENRTKTAAEKSKLSDRMQNLHDRIHELNSEISRLDLEAQRAQKTLERREEIETASSKATELKEKFTVLDKEVDKTQASIDSTNAFLLNHKDERIGCLRTALIDISAVGEGDPVIIAHQGLVRDQEIEKRGEEAPEKLTKKKGYYAELIHTRQDIIDDLRAAESLAAEAPLIKAAEETIKRVDGEKERISTEIQKSTAEREIKQLQHKKLSETNTAIGESINALERERKPLEEPAGLKDKLSQAEARIEELNENQKQTSTRMAAAQRELDALPPVDDIENIDLQEYERRIKTAESAHREAVEAVARAKKTLEDSEKSAKRIIELRAEHDAVAANLADWSRLAHDLGRDGLQAVEIDAAVPELNEIANDLLHSAFGTRFTVSVKANKTSADGKEELEGLEIRMIDTVKGRDDLIEFYSGGEKVWGAEAIALAQVFLLCRSYGIERPTIARDETAGALDTENGEAYVKMLRRAAEMLDADKILFVSHSPPMQDAADARIVINNGTIEVM